jgi:hypothetical protein
MKEENYSIKKRQQFAWIKDESGEVYLCPVNSLSDAKNITKEQLKNCVNDSLYLQPHSGG